MNAQQQVIAPTSHAAAPAEFPAPGRRSGLGVEEFIAEYRNPRRPVILTDATREWPIYGRGAPEYFRQRYGDHKLKVWGADMRLAELLDLLDASTPEQPGPYPCKYEIARDFRDLLPEVTPRFAYSLPDRQRNRLVPQKLFSYVNNLEIFFGGPGGQFPYVHYDVFHLHAWITQLHGDKEFTLYAPGQEHLLYINPDVPWQSTIKNHHKLDFERYPLLRQAKSQTVVIHAGETLFLPCGWWHTARSLNLTISVAFDQLGPDNWTDFVVDVADEQRRAGRSGKAALLNAYLRAIGPPIGLGERFGAGAARDWGSR
ncbi:MAG TPA: cupin-like domain-containing protein [Rhodanobacteraceae bacterium]|nr:cupin-like domain-containing protein [Rhodanobacteraceae bacterium]